MFRIRDCNLIARKKFIFDEVESAKCNKKAGINCSYYDNIEISILVLE
jgi:hypothetical protein